MRLEHDAVRQVGAAGGEGEQEIGSGVSHGLVPFQERPQGAEAHADA
jgi:hypothetical protein